MLEDLDKIDWSKLKHAYGEATDVPNLLRSLLSNDKKVRDDAMYELCGNILHQGTVYEASSYAIPFLQELLKSPDTPDKASIAALLADMGIGHGYYDHILGNNQMVKGIIHEEMWREILAKKGRVLEDEVDIGRKHAESTRLAVEKELHLLYPYLLHDEPYIRAVIAHSLANFPDFSHEILPLLEKALTLENDEDTRETIVNSISILREGNQ